MIGTNAYQLSWHDKVSFCLLCLLIHDFLNEKDLDKLPKTYYKHTVLLSNLLWTIFFCIFLYCVPGYMYVYDVYVYIHIYMIIDMRILLRNFTLDDPQGLQWYQY